LIEVTRTTQATAFSTVPREFDQKKYLPSSEPIEHTLIKVSEKREGKAPK